MRRYCWNILQKRIAKSKSKECTIEIVIKRKEDKLYVKWQGYNNLFNSWRDKKRHGINERNFPKLKSLGKNVKVEIESSNYATKSDFKNATGVDR